MLKMRKEVTKNSFYARGGRVGVSIKATVTYVKHVTETSTEASALLERQKIAAGKTSDPCGLMGETDTNRNATFPPCFLHGSPQFEV